MLCYTEYSSSPPRMHWLVKMRTLDLLVNVGLNLHVDTYYLCLYLNIWQSTHNISLLYYSNWCIIFLSSFLFWLSWQGHVQAAFLHCPLWSLKETFSFGRIKVFTPQPLKLEGYCHCLIRQADWGVPKLDMSVFILYRLSHSCNTCVVFYV